MVCRLEQLNMTFGFYQFMECNLYLVHEFYDNWDPRDLYHKVKVYGKVVRFIAEDITDMLGIPEADANQLRQMIITLNYAYIRHFLYGTHSAAK